MSNIDTQLDDALKALVTKFAGELKFREGSAAAAYINQTKSQILELINEARIEARLVELDLLEQAINMGLDINQYKMGRLKDLTNRGKE